MAKLIKLTQEHLDTVREQFMAALLKLKATDGELRFSFPLGKVDRRATLRFTETAAWKMKTLVQNFDSEVAWHGVAKRVDGAKDTFEISDILVYPQKVSGATVDDDTEKSGAWYDSLPDEVFNNLRMQGHSHVNMSVTPSGTDRDLYKKFLNAIDDTMFYIFLIWNKRDERTILIYDMRENVLFETEDVDVEVVEDGSGIAQFLEDAKSMVKRSVPAYSYSGSYYGGYSGSYGKNYHSGGSYQAGKTATGAAQGGASKSYGSSPADRDYATPPKGAAQPAKPADTSNKERMGRPSKKYKFTGKTQWYDYDPDYPEYYD